MPVNVCGCCVRSGDAGTQMIVWNGVMKKNGHLTATVYCCVKYSCLGMPVRKVLVRDVTGNVGLSAISGVDSTTTFWAASPGWRLLV